MTSTLNLSLTDELRAFVDSNCGDKTPYSTPSEFMRALLREKKDRVDAKALRDGIFEGYQDVLKGRHLVYEGNLRAVIQEAQTREAQGW